MRRRRLKRLWKRLPELRAMKPSRDELLMKLGAARKEAGRAWYLVKIRPPKADQPVTAETFQMKMASPTQTERLKTKQDSRPAGRCWHRLSFLVPCDRVTAVVCVALLLHVLQALADNIGFESIQLPAPRINGQAARARTQGLEVLGGWVSRTGIPGAGGRLAETA